MSPGKNIHISFFFVPIVFFPFLLSPLHFSSLSCSLLFTYSSLFLFPYDIHILYLSYPYSDSSSPPYLSIPLFFLRVLPILLLSSLLFLFPLISLSFFPSPLISPFMFLHFFWFPPFLFIFLFPLPFFHIPIHFFLLFPIFLFSPQKFPFPISLFQSPVSFSFLFLSCVFYFHLSPLLFFYSFLPCPFSHPGFFPHKIILSLT